MREVNVRSSRRSWLIVSLITITLVMIVGLVTADPGDPQLNTINGLVTDPLGGLPPPETKVFLVSPGGSIHGQANLEPSTGAFDLGPVPLGNYVLQAHPPDAGAYTPSMPVFLNITGGPVDAGVLA